MQLEQRLPYPRLAENDPAAIQECSERWWEALREQGVAERALEANLAANADLDRGRSQIAVRRKDLAAIWRGIGWSSITSWIAPRLEEILMALVEFHQELGEANQKHGLTFPALGASIEPPPWAREASARMSNGNSSSSRVRMRANRQMRGSRHAKSPEPSPGAEGQQIGRVTTSLKERGVRPVGRARLQSAYAQSEAERVVAMQENCGDRHASRLNGFRYCMRGVSPLQRRDG